jgi:large subunit ribosomal protein L41
MLFKPSQSLQRASRRLRLTTKNASVGGGYYKGTGVGSMGWHTQHGGYIIDLRKVRTFVPPEGVDGVEGVGLLHV